jgi:hypothetical protein
VSFDFACRQKWRDFGRSAWCRGWAGSTKDGCDQHSQNKARRSHLDPRHQNEKYTAPTMKNGAAPRESIGASRRFICGGNQGREFDVYGPTMLPSLRFRTWEVWLGALLIFTRLNWAQSTTKLITWCEGWPLEAWTRKLRVVRGCSRRKRMRLDALCLTGVLLAAATPLSAGAIPVAADHETGASARQAASARYPCPPGYYWEPDAYAPHGKFRPAHCALRW